MAARRFADSQKSELSELLARVDMTGVFIFERWQIPGEDTPPWYVWVALDAKRGEIARSGQFRMTMNASLPSSVSAAEAQQCFQG